MARAALVVSDLNSTNHMAVIRAAVGLPDWDIILRGQIEDEHQPNPSILGKRNLGLPSSLYVLSGDVLNPNSS